MASIKFAAIWLTSGLPVRERLGLRPAQHGKLERSSCKDFKLGHYPDTVHYMYFGHHICIIEHILMGELGC